jgi:hypothetical protein
VGCQCGPDDWLVRAAEPGDLQNVFDRWGGSKDGWRVAGATDWLLRCTGPNRTGEFFACNHSSYSFTPDVVWDNPEFLILELKFSGKHEAFGLAQVLHDGWRLGDPNISRRAARGCPTPVIITSCIDPVRIRAALSYLFHHGFRPEAIRYLEAAFLRAEDGTRFLWLEEPFAVWEPIDELPIDTPAVWGTSRVFWHRVAGSESWVGTRERVVPPRPFVPQEFAQISSIAGEPGYLVREWTGGRAGRAG